jgi:hypothetical protein
VGITDYSKKVTTLKEKLAAEEMWIFLTDTEHSLAETYKAIPLRLENPPLFVVYIATVKIVLIVAYSSCH